MIEGRHDLRDLLVSRVKASKLIDIYQVLDIWHHATLERDMGYNT